MQTTTTLGRALLLTCLLGPLSVYAAESEKAVEGKAPNVAVETREVKEVKDAKRFFRKESWAGSFRRTVSLPQAADSEKVQAELVDGVLTVVIPKREELKPRQIAVSVQ